VIAKPIAGGPSDFGNIGNPAATGGDSDMAARHIQLQRIELLEHRGANVRDWVRNQLLTYTQKSHGLGSFGRLPRSVGKPEYTGKSTDKGPRFTIVLGWKAKLQNPFYAVDSFSMLPV
jgi:hypothetical protein